MWCGPLLSRGVTASHHVAPCFHFRAFFADGMFVITVGIATGVTAAVASIPMVFDLDTALWFNEHYVTAEVADDKDL